MQAETVMDIVRITEKPISSDSEGEDMALEGTQIQGDYSGYVAPEVVVSDEVGTAKSSAPRTKPPSRGGPIQPESPTKVPVQVRGNLQKLGKRLKGWHQRYFEIQGSNLYYYKNHTKKEYLGAVNLGKCFFCEATTAATFGHAFEIRTTERTHTFAARSRSEMEQWVSVIKRNKGIKDEQEVTTKTSTKPKRWQSFKQALSVQPRRPPTGRPPSGAENTKKQNRKSLVNRLKINKNRERSISPAPSSQVTAHPPIAQDTSTAHLEAHSSRPLSVTEYDIEQDTLTILASLQPTRSLPSTPLVTKRPVNFNESPSDSPTFINRPASPALTLDSQLSTPSHSATTSPSHAIVSAAKDNQEGDDVSQEVVAKDKVTAAVEVEERKSEAENSELATPVVISAAEHGTSEEVVPTVESKEVATPVESVIGNTVASQEIVAHVDEKSVMREEPLSAAQSVPPIEDLTASEASVPKFMTKKFTWDEIREVLDASDEDERMDYSMLPPEDPVWLQKPPGIEQLRVFLLNCP